MMESVRLTKPVKMASLRSVTHTIGKLNHQTQQVYILKDRLNEIQKRIDDKRLRYKQIETVMRAHENYVNTTFSDHPAWNTEIDVNNTINRSSYTKDELTKITVLMSNQYEIARREYELVYITDEIQKDKIEHHRTSIELCKLQLTIRKIIQYHESSAEFYKIPFKFDRCKKALEETHHVFTMDI